MRFTWSKQRSEKGLARVIQSPRGLVLKRDGKEVGAVSPQMGGQGHAEVLGWYWVCTNVAGKSHNSLWNMPLYASPEDAKPACLAYAKSE